MSRFRRPHGSGGIYQRSRDGLWCAQIDDGFANGKRRRKTVYGATREIVEEKLAAVLRERGIDPVSIITERRPPTTWELARAKATHDPEDWALKVRLVGCCVYCGSTDDLEKDHATPVSRGGDDSIGNVVPSCGPCNMSKGDRTMAEFIVDRLLDAKATR